MPRRGDSPAHEDEREEHEEQELPADKNGSVKQIKRQVSVYDAVAGQIDVNGFKDQDTAPQITTRNGFPVREALSGPLEVLLGRVAAPSSGSSKIYFADQHLPNDESLPDSELLKTLHTYAADYYDKAIAGTRNSKDKDKNKSRGGSDYRSLDETALLALGILVEEAAEQALGENGDMVLVEPEGFDNFVPQTRAMQLQIHGCVPPVETPPYVSEDSSEDSEVDLGTRKKRQKALG